ncbi:MAG: VCBS repeat-containing protein [Bacteroidetes bacterium]|nr:VCBS repeat-containing protein [Bacteroidota bacterium]
MRNVAGKFYFQSFFLPVLILSFLEFERTSAHLNGVSLVSTVTTHRVSSVPFYPVLLASTTSKKNIMLYFDQENSSIVIAATESTEYFSKKNIIQQGTITNYLAAAKLNNDGFDDFISVQREKNSIEVFLSKGSDTVYSKQSYPVSFYPEKVIVSDINNDRIPDILCIGKLSSGIAVLLGKKNFTFQPVRTLFEGIPVNDIIVTNINGDRIPDLIIHNWLSNETQIYIGFGNLQYSLQSTFQFGSDTTHVLAADFTKDNNIDLAIASSQNKVLRLLAGDGLGSFQEVQTLPLSVFPAEMFLAHVHSSSSNDIVLDNTVEGSFSIVTTRAAGYWNDEVVYGCETGAGKLIVGDVDGDNINEIIRFTQNHEYEIFWNKNETSSLEQNLAVGNAPNAITIGDYNADGNLDIAVSNGASSTLDLLFNGEQYDFSNRLTVQVSNNPASLQWYAQNDTAITFLLRHGNPYQLSIITIESGKDTSRGMYEDIVSYIIPLQMRPSAVFPDISLTETGIHFFVTNFTSDNTIKYFKQVVETRFITKNLIPIVPAKILGANIADLNNDAHTDLLYTYFDDVTKGYYFGTTLNDSLDNFKGVSRNIPLPSKFVEKAVMLVDDFNGDGEKDCLLNLLPDNTLGIILGGTGGALQPYVLIDSNITVASTQDIQSIDYNQDGIPDIVLLERKSSTLYLYYGRGNGLFSPKIPLLGLPENASFRCADLNNDGFPDIVYTNPKKYYLTIHYGSK